MTEPAVLPPACTFEEVDDYLVPIITKPNGEREQAAWAPQPGSQAIFLRAPEDEIYEILLEGNRGGGKTAVLIASFLKHVGQGHGAAWRGIIFRREFDDLKDVWAKCEEIIPAVFPDAKPNQTDHCWTFRDGEKLLLRYAKKFEDVKGWKGQEWPFIGWEELTEQPTDELYKFMISSCRCSKPGVPKMLRSTTNPYGCVTHGDVLTEGGWVPIEQFSGGRVLTTDGLREATLVSHDYEGTLVSRKGAGLSMEFTEDHRLPHLNTERTKFVLKEFRDLPGQAIIQRTLPEWLGKSPATLYGYDAGDFMELLGWVLSEGCCVPRDRAIQIAQMKPENRERIASLLDRMGVHYRSDHQSFTLSGVYGLFEKQGYSYEKFVPRDYMNLDRTLLGRLLESLMLGDGCASTYYTNSRQLANDVQEIAVRLGKAVYTHTRQRPEREHLSYEVRMSERHTVQLNTGNHVYGMQTQCRSVNVERRPYKGRVFCLNVPGPETFFIRQNGCVWLSGNSGHNWVKARFRLPLRDRIVRVIDDEFDKDTGQKLPTRAVIHSDLRENKILLYADPDYIQRIVAGARNAEEKKAWLFGDWDVVAGGLIDDVWRRGEFAVVPEFPAAKIPHGWRIDRAYDHGQSAPFVVGWFAESNGESFEINGRRFGDVRGDLFLIREWYGWSGQPNIGVRMSSTQIAQGILEREGSWSLSGRVKVGPADDEIFAQGKRDGVEEKTPASKMADVGVRWVKANKGSGSRKRGWGLLRDRLEACVPDEEGHRERPGFFVSESCYQWLRTVPTLTRGSLDPDDVDKKAEDHAADMTRYRLAVETNRMTRKRIQGR